jgi:hypothetical protein
MVIMNLRKLSWKTASAGILSISAALIGFISAWAAGGHYPGDAAAIAALTGILNGVGLLVARDNDKTSQEVGADRFAAQREKEV